MRFFARVLLFCAFVLPASAQQPNTKTPLPKGPLLVRAPEMSRWTITNFYQSDPNGKDTMPFSSLTKTGDMIYEAARDVNGKICQKWTVGNVQAFLVPGRTNWIVTPMGQSSFQSDYSKTDFPDFAWISPATYAGSVVYGGHSCLVFKPGGGGAQDPSQTPPVLSGTSGGDTPPPPSANVEAYVDIQTRLPVCFRQDDLVRIYQFQPPPPAKLVLPPDLKPQIDALTPQPTAGH